MSVHVASAVWANSEQKGSALLVLLALADYANDEGVCWPSVASLQKRSRLSRRSVQLQLRRLEAAGEIEPVGETAHGVVRYRVLVRGENFAPPIYGGRGHVRGGAQQDSPGGEASLAGGAQQDSPEPSLEPSNKSPKNQKGGTQKPNGDQTPLAIVKASLLRDHYGGGMYSDPPPIFERTFGSLQMGPLSDGSVTLFHPEPEIFDSALRRMLDKAFVGVLGRAIDVRIQAFEEEA